MPAYFDQGFSVRRPMWHGEGDITDEYPADFAEARRWAGIEWEPELRMPYRLVPIVAGAEYPDGSLVASDVDGECGMIVPVPEHRLVTRNDTEAVLGVPTDSYSLLTHHHMGELLDAIVGEGGTAVRFETMGSAAGGKRVWALCYLDEPYTIPGDESATYPYFAALWAHDGGAASRVLPTQVRVVCWNTWNAAAAAGDSTGHQVVIRHVGNVAERVAEAKAVLAGARADADEWRTMAGELAGLNVDDALVKMFLDRFIPEPEGDDVAARVVNDRAMRRETFMALYETSPTTDAVRGTAYGLVQAAGEYLDHFRPYRSRDTYLARTLLRPEPIKARSIALVRELVEAGAE